VQTILEYVGQSNIRNVIKGAQDQKDALRKFKENNDSFQRPIVSHSLALVCWGSADRAGSPCMKDCELTKEQTVDWNNGKAVIGENESEILKLVKASQQ
jgi:hypothetical protein